MAIQFIDKKTGATTSTAIANDATGRAKIQNLPDAAGIAYDAVDGSLKYNDNGTIRAISAASGATAQKIVGGTTALDGSNPTTVTTGLTTVTAFVVSLQDTGGVDSGTAFVTSGAPTGGSVPVYGWVVAGTASTGTETFNWIAVGS